LTSASPGIGAARSVRLSNITSVCSIHIEPPALTPLGAGGGLFNAQEAET
jgi:hypothetical protein